MRVRDIADYVRGVAAPPAPRKGSDSPRLDDAEAPLRVLLINASSRSEHSCPGELSKSWRLATIAREVLEEQGLATEFLDLSRLTSEYGRNIHPCKACFSTAAALCHWPCSCYPNYSLGQAQDMMNDIYPLWVETHGVMIVTPVNWYSPTSPLKLMMDRLVCADRDTAIQDEVRNAARTLAEALRAQRAGRLHRSGEGLTEPRPK